MLEETELKKLSVIIVLLWMAVIFYNSSNNYVVSNEKSFGVLNILRDGKNIVLDKDNKAGVNNNDSKLSKSENQLHQTVKEENWNIFIRKNAHAFEYIILAILVSNMLILHGMRGRDAIIYIMFISLLYAVTDEYHQLFVQGRGSLVSDVLIDFGGSLVGLGIYYLFKFEILSRRKHN